ncbi:MAG TPA: DUF2382 domain-containing protein [Rubrobacter sp.]|nr:DUF2382 domain-containing protein [Rubrobacter sp.]
MAYEGRSEQPPDDDPVGSVAAEKCSDLEEDLRVQRSEEEVRAGIRRREAGQVNVKKGVRTERELVRVPKRREEVVIERVPVEDEAREASTATVTDIGEDEVVVQVFEEEIVVSKKIVLRSCSKRRSVSERGSPGTRKPSRWTCARKRSR